MPLLGALFQYPDELYIPTPPDYGVIVDLETKTGVNVISYFEKRYVSVGTVPPSYIEVLEGQKIDASVYKDTSTVVSVTRIPRSA